MSAIARWYEARKCHRIDQLMFDHPEFSQHVASQYNAAMDSTADDFPSKCTIATRMIRDDVPGFTDAVLEMDRRKQYRDVMPRAQRTRETASGRAA